MISAEHLLRREKRLKRMVDRKKNGIINLRMRSTVDTH